MPRLGVLLINTGTPDEPTEEAIARYLEEMLSDPALISAPPIIWKRVLKYIILPKRPKATKPVYERIWTDDGSLFMCVSEKQAARIAEMLGKDYVVELAMRYGNPSIRSRLERLREAGVEQVVAVPLYPQYVNVCAGTCLAEVRRCMEEMRLLGWDAELSEVRDFYNEDSYIHALAESIRTAWPQMQGKLVFSWHSTLLADIEAGDPYKEQCEQTAQMVADELGLDSESWIVAYQSRFDSRKWLQPLIGDTLDCFAADGVDEVCVVCPGFVADNIETLVEIGETMRDRFLTSAPAGARFTYVPTLNVDEGLLQAVCESVREAARAFATPGA